MTERPKPYIGISGVIHTAQQYNLMDQFALQELDEIPIDRKISLGVKAVHKTQFLDIGNKYGTDWYPVGAEAFSSALDSGGIDALKTAQICLDPDRVDDLEYRRVFIERIRLRGAAWLNTLQFDMAPWHTDSSFLPFVEKLKNETGLGVIIQAHEESMRQLGPEGVVRALGRCAHALDYILFDASHGKGVRLNTEALKPFVDAAYNADRLSSVGIAIAGGLNAVTVREDLPALVKDYPDLCWDAEGQLHPERADGTRPLDMSLSFQYLNASAEILRRV